MSISLYNAYKMPKMDLASFFELVKKIKVAVAELQSQKYEELMMKNLLRLYDHKTLYPQMQVLFEHHPYAKNKEKISGENLVAHYLIAQQKKLESLSKMDEFYFRVDAYFSEEHLYLTTREIPNSEYHKIIPEIIKDAELYEYYDNVDHPPEVTRREWKAREIEWEKVFANTSWSNKNAVQIPCEFDVSWHRVQKPKLKLSVDLISDKNRGKESVRDGLCENFIKKEGVTQIQDFPNVILSEEFRDALANKLVEINPHLNHKLTLEELLKEEYVLIKTVEDYQRKDISLTIFSF